LTQNVLPHVLKSSHKIHRGISLLLSEFVIYEKITSC